jgi:UDP-2,4-diacetamido-2,4,6-trideoxy-beta-L-altropyranose hydrolase
MNVTFRVDASTWIGTGHVMRCLTLATALQARGAAARFVCRDHEGNLIAMLRARGFPVTVLPAPLQRGAADQDYASWLGVSQTEDADRTCEALAGARPDWLIADHYGLDAEWETRLRPHVSRLFVITDLNDRRHDCDLLLDQNYSASEARLRSLGLVPHESRVLAGPWFALLQSEYAIRRHTMRPRDGHVRRVLLFFGGSDPGNAAAVALEALSRDEFTPLAVDFVIGANCPHRAALEALAGARPRTAVHSGLPHLADLVVDADLALGAGGTATWERMCLGLPAIVVSIAENQRQACEALSRDGLILYLGNAAAVESSDVARALEDVMKDPDRLKALSTGARLLVDGLGTARLVEALMPSRPTELKLRPAAPDDIERYFHWVNDPEVRRQSLNADRIAWDTHQEWFETRLSDPHAQLFVLMAGALPVGQIRFDRREGEAWIDYSLDPLVRGRGWATRLVSLGCALVDPRLPLKAKVKPGNQASRAVFSRLGFERDPSASAAGVDVFMAQSCQGLTV